MISKLNHISQGEGIPLIFQHGLTANVNQTVNLLGGLEGIHLLSIDCPGHGLTNLPKDYIPSFNHYADEVIGLLDQLGIDQAIFGGISMGSGIAINIALRYPDRVRALILVRPAWLDQTDPRNLQILILAAEMIHKHKGQMQFQELKDLRDISFSVPAAAKSILGVFSDEQQAELPIVIKHMVGDRPFTDIAYLRKIKVPCLIVGTEDDPLHPYGMAEKIHKTIQGSVLRKLTSRYIDDNLHRKQVRESIQQFIKENKLHL